MLGKKDKSVSSCCWSELLLISFLNSSLLKCLPPTTEARVLIPSQDMSVSGALLEDGDDLGQVSP
jgi:hypothetical protein